MNISKLIQSAFVLLALLHLSSTQATEVGSLKGQAGVSPSGAATYSIPIEVPSALSGLQPSISLQYNSQSRSMPHPMKISDIRPEAGSMGIGWGIGGLSAISRCPTDLTRDDFIDTVDYDDNDQFCLDGQRLVLISGFHGATGSEYRTETNGEVRVLAISDGPQSFKVIHKNGQVSEYGNSYDSKQESYDSTNIHRWNISSINNSTGNEINFLYEKNVAKLIYRISEIQYEDKGIKFSYDDEITQKKLTSITTTTSNSTIYNYSILWGENPSSTRTDHVVTNIRKCDKLSKCLSSTSFEWSKSDHLAGFGDRHSSYNLQNGLNPSVYSNQNYLTSDVNGDGRADLTWVWNYKNQLGRVVWLANKSGTGFNSSHSSYTTSNSFYPSAYSNQKYHLADINGDGKSDLIWTWRYQKQLGRVVWLANKNGDGFESKHSSYGLQNGFHPDVYSNQHYIMSDVNGDGKADLTWLWNYQNQLGRVVWLANESGAGFNSSHSSYTISKSFYPSAYNNQQYHLADINGDGKSDLVWTWRYQKQLGRVVWQANKNGDGFESNHSSYKLQNGFHPDVYSNQQYIISDVNGDGKSDLTWVWNYQNQLGRVLWLANDAGTGFSSSQTSYSLLNSFYPSSYNDQNYQLADINSDGKLDILWTWRYQKQLGRVVWLANENGDAFQKNHTSYALQNGFHPDVYDNKRIILGDFNGDSQIDLLWVWNYQNQLGRVSYIRNTESPDKVKMITDGNSKGTYFNYKSLVDSSVYSKESNSNYPSTDFQGPVNVVSKIESDNSFDGTNSTSYFYEGMKTHRLGLGNLGFAKVTATNDQTGIKSITDFSQDYEKRLVGAPISEYSVLPNGVIRTRTDTTYDSILQSDSKRYSITVRKSEIQEKSISGSNVSNTLVMNCHSDYVGCTSATHDQYGNSTYGKKIVTDQQNGGTFTTENTNTFWPLNSFSSSSNTWFTSQIKKATVTKWDSTNSAKTGTTEFNSYYANGKLKKETVEPGAAQLVSEYEYNDEYGRLTKTTVSGSDFATRYGAISYDSNNPYRMTEKNALGQSSITELDPVFGKTLFKQDRNGIRINYAYDDFGKLKLVSYPTGASDSYSYNWCNASICPDSGKYYIQKTVSDAGTQSVSRVIFDKLERQISATSQAFDGSTVYVNSYYDSLGRKYKESNPFRTGETEYVTETTAYDVLNRAKSITHPDGSTSSVEYSGLLTTYTNQENQEKMVQLNAIGQIIESTDDNYKKVSYGYGAMGNQSLVKDEANNEIRSTYDIRGNRLTINDPDKGLWTSVYNVRGQLITHTDAKGQTTCSAYDTLDRKIKRIDLYQGTKAQAKAGCIGDTSNPSLTTWHYDTAIGKGIGKLHQVRGESGYVKTYYYDHLGRSITQDTTIAGLAYRTGRIFYPNSDRVKQQAYPTANGTAFNITNLYNSRGYLYRTENTATKAAYWIANEMDAQGNVTNFTLGNGVTTAQAYQPDTGYLASIDSQKNASTIQYLDYSFDAIGNLKYRRDLIKGYSEYLSYDNINRLTSSTVSGLHSNYSNFSYDTNGLGNLKSKTGVGTYTYGFPNQGCAIKTAGPHAVTQISGGFMQPAASYCYDKNGSMISGGNRSISYTPFDKPEVINRNGQRVSFTYGPNRNRIQKSDQSGTTTYINGAYEKTVKGNTTQVKYYVGNYAVVTVENNIANTHYLHRDHIGSVDAITDESGTVRERQSFDAWGKRRHSDWQSPLDLFSYQSSITNRGFTNHEQLDSVGLVHMNGRAYDPILGRFVSADPFVQDVSDLQSLNRYSYVHNNPLSHTDPSGYFLKKLIGDADQGLKNFDDYATSKLDHFGANNNELTNIVVSLALIGTPGGQWYGYRHGTLTSTTFRIGSGVAAAAADKLLGCAGACSAANAYLQVKILGGSDEQALTSAGFSYISYLAFSSSEISGWGHVGGRAVAGGSLAVAQNRMMGGSSADDGTVFRLGFTARLLGDSMQYYIESNNDLTGDAEPSPMPGHGVDKTKAANGANVQHVQKVSNVGIAAKFKNGVQEFKHHPLMYETSPLMQSIAKVPGMNYMSAFHDTWMEGVTSSWVQWSIIPATGATYTMFYQQERQRSYMESLVTN